MRRRLYYFRYWIRAGRPLLAMAAGIALIFMIAAGKQDEIKEALNSLYEEYGVMAAEQIWENWLPHAGTDSKEGIQNYSKTEVITYLEEIESVHESSEDPAYERMFAKAWEERYGDLVTTEGTNKDVNLEQIMREIGINIDDGSTSEEDQTSAGSVFSAEAVPIKPSGSAIIREKLADYDYVIKNFYSIHPTTTAGRDLVDAEKFLSMDLSVEQAADKPQILIYHTHSQETFSDYNENPNATIVGVGTYLTELLEAKGYQVIHDTSVYDYKNGKLDRSQAYTYALEGITGILQKNPSIEVVLDVHRDGVAEGTKLVTEVNGKPTAQIMFFNGTSQTPDGPIEYLPNPNREANMAFSFQMQLKATEQYPGFTRHIYLKGLRYNQHVRARAALIEVGAQTNTYAEALNAMEPLADILCPVLNGD